MNIASLLTRISPALIAFAILFAIAGQAALNEQNIPFGIFFFVLAVVMFIASLPDDLATTLAPTTNTPHTLPRWWRVFFAIASAICTLIAFTVNTEPIVFSRRRARVSIHSARRRVMDCECLFFPCRILGTGKKHLGMARANRQLDRTMAQWI